MSAHEAHEIHERAEHAAHAGGHVSINRRIALLIAVLAAGLAIVESGASSSQNKQMTFNIQASDTWAFFQAKTIRRALALNAAETLETTAPDSLSPERAAKVAAVAANWRKDAARLESDPEQHEGRQELMAKARAYEAQRDEAGAAFHNFEYGAAALQLSIALASASVVTGQPVLAGGAAALGLVGAVLGGLGWFAPHVLHNLIGTDHAHDAGHGTPAAGSGHAGAGAAGAH